MRDDFAVRERTRRPASGSVLSLPLLLDMPSSTTAGSPSVAYAQFLRRQHRPSPSVEQLGTPNSHHPLPMVSVFAVSPVRSSLQPVELLASLGGSDRVLPSQPRLLLPGFRWVAYPPIAGCNYGGNWASLTGGTFTTSASIAAPTPPDMRVRIRRLKSRTAQSPLKLEHPQGLLQRSASVGFLRRCARTCSPVHRPEHQRRTVEGLTLW
jgi:hypothetical protein